MGRGRPRADWHGTPAAVAVRNCNDFNPITNFYGILVVGVKMRNENRNPETRKTSRARYARTEKGRATRKRAAVVRLQKEREIAAVERKTLREVPCPHCGQALIMPGNSTFVLKKEDVGKEFRVEDYHPNPARTYVTSEASRRRQLAYYWRNREKVLARERDKRIAAGCSVRDSRI